jgi:hypothetical protein
LPAQVCPRWRAGSRARQCPRPRQLRGAFSAKQKVLGRTRNHGGNSGAIVTKTVRRGRRCQGSERRPFDGGKSTAG